MPIQILVNALIAGSQYALIGIGFALVFRVARIFHFAHGAVFTAGAYGAYLGHAVLGLGLPLSTALGIAVACVAGCAVEFGVYRPLRRRSSPDVVFLLASLGSYIVLQNTLSLAFGDNQRSMRDLQGVSALGFAGARITMTQLVGLGLAVAMVVSIAGLLKHTRVGMAIRAVADDSTLAEASGIRSARVILLATVLASALAGFAGVVVGLDVDISPPMGLRLLMMGVVAFVVGGTGSTLGVAGGAFLLALLQHTGAWFLGSQWQDAIAFLLLLAFLIARPSGLFGGRFAWRHE